MATLETSAPPQWHRLYILGEDDPTENATRALLRRIAGRRGQIAQQGVRFNVFAVTNRQLAMRAVQDGFARRGIQRLPALLTPAAVVHGAAAIAAHYARGEHHDATMVRALASGDDYVGDYLRRAAQEPVDDTAMGEPPLDTARLASGIAEHQERRNHHRAPPHDAPRTRDVPRTRDAPPARDAAPAIAANVAVHRTDVINHDYDDYDPADAQMMRAHLNNVPSDE